MDLVSKFYSEGMLVVETCAGTLQIAKTSSYLIKNCRFLGFAKGCVCVHDMLSLHVEIYAK